ncbi:MAG: mechanosensitive ion channel [Pseudomonadota bacterium]|nr:mechanosensitive ion channel [Pseudomonadota bacterium]
MTTPTEEVTETISKSVDFLTKTDWLGEYLIPWGTRIVFALIIFIVGRWIVKAMVKALRRALAKANMDQMLINFLSNIAYMALLVVVVLAVLEQLGVNTTSALAVFGAAGLAIGLALQGSLSNFAAGVMLVFFRPFNTGNFVEVAGVTGIVEEIRIFSTVLRTPDNREIIIPNGQINDDKIVNFSARDTRRIDLVLGIGYGDDIGKARQLIEEIISGDERILADPEPQVMLLELADSSVNIATRPWVRSSDYWAVRADLLEKVKASFDSNGISIPYPQQDVHLVSDKAA